MGLSVDPSQFHDYACAKAYDILSKGRYKKFLLHSQALGEEWACKSVQSVQDVQECIDGIQKLLENVSILQLEEDGIHCASLVQACIYVLDMHLPPKKKRHNASTCCVTGAALRGEVHTHTLHLCPCPQRNFFFSEVQNDCQEGIEISKDKASSLLHDCADDQGKAKRSKKLPCVDLVVHPRFMHFLHMLWLIGRIDHVMRSIVRCWQHEHADTACGSIEDCQIFLQEESAHIHSLGLMFSHAVQHVHESLKILISKKSCKK